MSGIWKKLTSPIIALAPMAGVTDSAFRRLCQSCRADLVYTEMISADALYYQSKKTLEMLKISRSEKPVIAQLFGKRLFSFSKAIKLCHRAGFDGIDINFGCPAKKVVSHGGGVTLMKDLDFCRRIIETAVKTSRLPVSVKIRAGIGSITALDFLEKIRDLPVSAVMIHGRYFKNPFSGPVDFEIIKQAKKLFQGKVLANGGIVSPETAREALDKTGADGLGLARGVCGRPWLFQEIKEFLETGRYHRPDTSEIKKIIKKHGRFAYQTKGDRGIIELRKHLLWYTAGRPRAKALRCRLVRISDLRELDEVLEEF